MKIIVKIFSFFVISFLSFSQIFGDYTTLSTSTKIKLQSSYKEFSVKISNKYSLQKEKIFLEKLSKKLEILEKDFKYKKYNDFISYLIYLNTLEIKSISEKIDFYNSKKQAIEEENSKFILNKTALEKYSFTKYFKNISYNKEAIFLENGVWYYFNYKDFIYFGDDLNKISISDLRYNKIDTEKDLITFDEKLGIIFVKDYKKVRLIDDKIISNISNKYDFLSVLKDDKISIYNSNYDADFLKLKDFSVGLTKDLSSKDEKIEKIYNYILNNISYVKNPDLSNYYISSGIETYKSRIGVCSGYTKLFFYMLYFSGMEDVSYIPGFVLDSSDFPYVGHAWIKIGNYYYDPTFDDPIGNKGNITKKDYKYFKLDYDLFYTNRYDSNNFPESYKNLSLEKRKNIVSDRLYNLAFKDIFKYKNEKLLEPYIFKIENNLGNKKLDINDIKKITPYYEVNSDNSLVLNGTKKYISFVNYYTLDNSNVETVVSQLDYNFKNTYLLDWNLANGNKEYRLAYELRF